MMRPKAKNRDLNNQMRPKAVKLVIYKQSDATKSGKNLDLNKQMRPKAVKIKI